VAFYTYILASDRNGTLYVGMTDDLEGRVGQHRAGVFDGFTARYGVHRLVWWQAHETRDRAFARERAIKKWRRQWKLEMIEHSNPGWRDLLSDFVAERDRLWTSADLPWRFQPQPSASQALTSDFLSTQYPAHPRESGDPGLSSPTPGVRKPGSPLSRG
jgi:putative endonuclease